MDKGSPCAGCKSPVGQSHMKCSGCKQKFDILCAGFTESNYKKLSKSQKNVWVCLNCRSKIPRGDNSNTPVRQAPALDSRDFISGEISPTGNVTMRTKVRLENTSSLEQDTNTTSEVIRKIIREEIQIALRDCLENSIGKMCSEIKEFRESLTFLNSQFEEIKLETKEKNRTIERLDSENKELRHIVNSLRQEMNHVQQQSRSTNLEIQCVPEHKSENLYSLVKQLTSKVKCDVSEKDVLHCTRVSKLDHKSQRPRSIVVKLSSQKIRDTVLAACIKYNKANPKDKLHAAHLGISCENIVPIFVTEHLSPDNKSLHAATRKKAKDLNYKYAWVRNGHIFLRKTDFSERILINNIDKLKSLPN